MLGEGPIVLVGRRIGRGILYGCGGLSGSVFFREGFRVYMLWLATYKNTADRDCPCSS